MKNVASWTDSDLRRKLNEINGSGYKAYGEIRGEYLFPQYILAIDHVQGDPFATPSRIRARVSQKDALFATELYSSDVRRIALQDYISRQFAAAAKRLVKGNRGTGHSGQIAIDAGGQEILERTSCLVTDEFVEVRFTLGLPAYGRSVASREAIPMFFDEIPAIVAASLYYSAMDPDDMSQHIEVAEDQETLRAQLSAKGLVAFVADGSILPRASGVSEKPLQSPRLVPFAAPDDLRVEMETPNRGTITGMGIPEGVTLICGGGYHGKSTLLRALDRGAYNHVPGDGREYIVSRRDSVKVRAEDGRSIQTVDISPFINNLPFEEATSAFTTENASGSTSQAANIVEALEYGTSLLLIDEDTSATNFMIRDGRMQRLVPKDEEPITPFIDQVQNLYKDYGVSSIVVVGGSGDYFEVADTIIAMADYLPSVVTTEAHRIAMEMPTQRHKESGATFGKIRRRAVVSQSLEPYRRGRLKVDARGLNTIEFGHDRIDLQDVEQLVDVSQTRAIGEILVYALNQGYFDREIPMVEALQKVYAEIAAHGLDVISPHRSHHPGDLALPRLQEAAAALNRLRSLRIKQV